MVIGGEHTEPGQTKALVHRGLALRLRAVGPELVRCPKGNSIGLPIKMDITKETMYTDSWHRQDFADVFSSVVPVICRFTHVVGETAPRKPSLSVWNVGSGAVSRLRRRGLASFERPLVGRSLPAFARAVVFSIAI